MKRLPPLPLFAALLALSGLYAASVPRAAVKDGDFVHLWVGGRIVAKGLWDQLYDPPTHRRLIAEAFGGALPDTLWAERNDLLGAFFYPPPAALAYAPFGALDLHLAEGIHAAILLLLAPLAAWVCSALATEAAGEERSPYAFLALILALPSFFYAFVLGQNGLFALVLAAGAALAAVRRRDVLAGVLLGALVLKPSWLVAVGWIPLVQGRFRLVGVAGLSAMALSLALGPGPLGDFLQRLPLLSDLPNLPNYPLEHIYNLASLPRRALGLTPLAGALGAALALACAAAAAWRARALPPARAWVLGLAVAPLVNPHVHHYDMLLGLPALAVLTGGRRTWLLVVHHGAFVLTDALGVSAWLPLPTFAAALVALLMARQDPEPV